MSGVIRDEADAFAFERGKFIFHQHVNAIKHRKFFIKRTGSRTRRRAALRTYARWQRTRHIRKIKVRHPLRRQRTQLFPQRDHAPLLRRMISIRQKDHKGFGEWINPDGRARPTGVAVRTQRENFPARTAVASINVPADTAPPVHIGWRLHAGHQLHRLRLEDAHAIEFTEIEQHPGITRQVTRSDKQPRMSCHASHAPRSRIVNHAPHRRAALDFRWRDAIQLFLGRIETRVFHSERAVEFALKKLIQRLA